jgi:transcriptional regulator with PAS, ATPase and Fis domain/CHASE2 domain-containing sensor protein
MAQPAIDLRTLRAPVIALVAALLGIIVLRGPLAVLDDQANTLQYAVRGTVQPDTNIVVIYIDDAAVRVLGWPLRRNFHALMLSALADLKVRAIGMELFFEDPRTEYPEYDDLFARMLSVSPPTILTCYFDTLASQSPVNDSVRSIVEGGDRFTYAAVDEPPHHGRGYHGPLRPFHAAAAGVGHVNFIGRGTVPLFIVTGGAIVPAFGLEIVRAFAGTERGGLQSDGDEITMKTRGRKLRWTTEEGAVTLNYPCALRGFTAYPFLEVLRAYDNARRDLPASIPVASLRDKIVLIGVAAEGRGVVFDTPVDPRLPSIGMHATLVDNLLQSRLMHHAGLELLILLSVVTGVLCGAALLLLRSPWDKIAPPGIFLLLIGASYVLFALYAFRLPVVSPVLVGLATVAAAGMARHRVMRQQVDVLSAEKGAVLNMLRDREARLAMLERQLLDAQVDRSAGQTKELLEEIKKYKAEIRSLSSRADDMEESTPGGDSNAVATFEGIVYHRTGPMREPVEFVRKIASSDAPVLILGESGTGKELIARAIHRLSNRHEAPFIAVNCGALSETLLESELFGHEKGAFTGAVRDKPGRFELADGGTIFLDEIGEVSESFQLKLLRVLQEGELERVGGTTTLKVKVRVLAATNKDLKERVKAKQFRDDLYYRLNVLTMSIPPLRDRQEDIPLLVEHFLGREGGALRVSRNVMEALRTHAWPGNVRELESTIRRGALLAKAEQRTMLTVKDLTDELADAAAGKIPVQDQVLEMIRELGFSRSAVTETAAALGGLNRGTVAEYLRGESLKTFVDQQYDLERAVKYLALSNDPAIHERVRKRYLEYLTNIIDGLDASQPWETARLVLKSKSKNLPQRYHIYLEQCAEAHFRGIWRLP